jgi:maltose/moltooligosaccharide transporter
MRALAARTLTGSFVCIGAGMAVTLLVAELTLKKEVYLLGGLLIAYGTASIAAIRLAKAGRDNNMLSHIVGDFAGMPPVMKQLALVQFFSWSALFIMWINTTPVVAQYVFGSSDPTSAAYSEGGNWVGVLFAVYNGVAALAALFVLPTLAKRLGKVRTHMICLLCGALGYASFLVFHGQFSFDLGSAVVPVMRSQSGFPFVSFALESRHLLLGAQHLLLISEIGVGIAWASILAMPYAILASALPQAKLGIYMGLFNIFIVVPQLLVATVMGSIMKAFFPTEPIWTMLFAAIVMGLAALAMLRVKEAL